VGDLANRPLDCALRRLQIAFDFVLRALFHLSPRLPLTLWNARWILPRLPGRAFSMVSIKPRTWEH
jgi:hypothetical protein